MMKIASKFGELSPCCLLLSLLLVLGYFIVMFVEILPDFIILGLNVLQILLTGIEVMFILA